MKRYEGKEFKKPVYMNSMDTNNNHGIAAIIMDAQPKLLASLVETERQLLTGSLEFLVKSMQVLNIPVLLTEQVPEKLGKTIPEISDLMSDSSAFEKTTFLLLEQTNFLHGLNKTISSKFSSEELKPQSVFIKQR